MEKIVGVAQLYFMPHPLLEIVQRLMAHPVVLFSFFLSLFVLSVLHFWSVSKQIEGVDMSRDQLLRPSYPKKY